METLSSYWYIACASAQLGAAPRAARVLDLDLALFRGGDGRPRALRDRCCHRGVQLSRGRVVDGNLACGYHGWRFDGAGRCVHIPSLVDGRRIAAGCGVPALACEERDGYVWVWTGSGEPPPPPGIPGFAARRWSQGSVAMGCDWLRALENNLDWCHPVFAHPWTHGQFYQALLRGDLGAQGLVLQATPDGLRVHGPARALDEPTDARSVTLSFHLPCRAEIVGPGARRIVVHCVPTGSDACRLEWLMARSLPIGPRVRWRSGEPILFRQDRVLLESASAGDERSVEADAPTLLLRKVVQLDARGSWDAQRAAAEGRRLLRVRA